MGVCTIRWVIICYYSNVFYLEGQHTRFKTFYFAKIADYVFNLFMKQQKTLK